MYQAERRLCWEIDKKKCVLLCFSKNILYLLTCPRKCRSTIFRRLKAIEMIQKQSTNWSRETSKGAKWSVASKKSCFCSQKKKFFASYCIATSDEKWIRYDNSKRKKSWCRIGEPSISTAKLNIHGAKLMLCIWWDLGVVYYALFQPNEIIIEECCQ